MGGSLSFDFDASRVKSEMEEQPGGSKSECVKPAAWVNHVLVIVSNRFGIERVSEEYFKVIKKYMKLSSFVGLVGGKPRFAYYFVGHLERPAENEKALARLYNGHGSSLEKKEKDEADRLVFLDPHYVSPQVNPTTNIAAQEPYYHCSFPARSIHMSQLDPCMSFGFLLKSQAEFTQFSNEIANGLREDGDVSIFHLQDKLDISLRSIVSISTSQMFSQ